MLEFLLLDEKSRNLLRLWLSGRERPYGITYVRWSKLKSGSTAKLAHNELAEIMDRFGPQILDLLMLPIDAKTSLIGSMRFQVEKDGGLVPSTDVHHILDIARVKQEMQRSI